MSKALTLLALLVLVAAPGFAQAPSTAPLDLAAILGLSDGPGFAPPQSQVHFLAGGGIGSPSDVTCTATCGTDPSVSCSVSSGTCTAANRSCPGEQGHVTCGTSTFYCSTPCPECTDGTFRTFPTGDCCLEGTVERERDVCVGGTWQFQSLSCGRVCGPF